MEFEDDDFYVKAGSIVVGSLSLILRRARLG